MCMRIYTVIHYNHVYMCISLSLYIYIYIYVYTYITIIIIIIYNCSLLSLIYETTAIIIIHMSAVPPRAAPLPEADRDGGCRTSTICLLNARHAYIYICMCVYIYIYICICMYLRIYVYVCIYIYIYMYTCILGELHV